MKLRGGAHSNVPCQHQTNPSGLIVVNVKILAVIKIFPAANQHELDSTVTNDISGIH
jgi:hypothetical protein